MIDASPLLVYGFATLGIALVIAVAITLRSVRAAVLLGVWLALTAIIAARGLVGFDSMPPRMLVLAFASNIAAVYVGLKIDAPLRALIALQAFRLPLELLMHRAYEEGVMPVQMSYSGLNFDIVTGTLAIVVAFFAHRRGVVLAWNILGTLLLVNIVTIAMLSTPIPLRVFHNEPANVWIARPPFVWLPAFFVPVAVAGHVAIFRKLRRRQGDGAAR
ncbi:MAG TPA: hypothetical protein VE010_11695 [Thermoanaerobaculia bacterium]|nr:hypothetical protein [Thermoanaerobaculia bacterium]